MRTVARLGLGPRRGVSLRRLFHGSSFLGRKQEFLTPAVGEGITDLEILEWGIKVGDQVQEFDKICEVQTDKATVDLSSRYTGTVTAIHYNIGDIARVGTPLISIEVDDSADASSKTPEKGMQTPPPESKPMALPEETSSSSSKVSPLASPAVRRLAKEHNVDLSLVVGTGPAGRVLKHDVQVFIDGSDAGGESLKSFQDEKVPANTAVTSHSPVQRASTPKQDKVIKITGLARIMVRTMTDAAHIPAMGLSEEIIVTDLMAMRKSLKDQALTQYNAKLTMLPFILKALSLSMREFPIINGLVNQDASEVLAKAEHNIGVAMDTPRGLLVPNIKNVEDKSIIEIALDLNRLQKLGEQNKLGPDDLSGGTFTLSNVGAIGGTVASPILFVPQVAIGALGRAQVLPRFDKDGQVSAQHVMNVSWSADHRVVDGATLARFSNHFRSCLEHPHRMFLHLR